MLTGLGNEYNRGRHDGRSELLLQIGEMELDPNKILDIMCELIPKHVDPDWQLMRKQANAIAESFPLK